MQIKKISVNTPLSHCDIIREAMGNAGAGRIGNYTHCSFSVQGTGRSKHTLEAIPFAFEIVEEERIETFCNPDQLKDIVIAIRDAHPYEEPVITIQDAEVY